MKRKKSGWFYMSILTILLGLMQLAYGLIDARKYYVLSHYGIVVSGVVIDKNITERTESIYTGYRLKFETQSLNDIYSSRFFKSVDSHQNYGDTLRVMHYALDPSISQLENLKDKYGSMVFNFSIGILLLVMGIVGAKKCIALGNFIVGN